MADRAEFRFILVDQGGHGGGAAQAAGIGGAGPVPADTKRSAHDRLASQRDAERQAERDDVAGMAAAAAVKTASVVKAAGMAPGTPIPGKDDEDGAQMGPAIAPDPAVAAAAAVAAQNAAIAASGNAIPIGSPGPVSQPGPAVQGTGPGTIPAPGQPADPLAAPGQPTGPLAASPQPADPLAAAQVRHQKNQAARAAAAATGIPVPGVINPGAPPLPPVPVDEDEDGLTPAQLAAKKADLARSKVTASAARARGIISQVANPSVGGAASALGATGIAGLAAVGVAAFAAAAAIFVTVKAVTAFEAAMMRTASQLSDVSPALAMAQAIRERDLTLASIERGRVLGPGLSSFVKERTAQEIALQTSFDAATAAILQEIMPFMKLATTVLEFIAANAPAIVEVMAMIARLAPGPLGVLLRMGALVEPIADWLGIELGARGDNFIDLFDRLNVLEAGRAGRPGPVVAGLDPGDPFVDLVIRPLVGIRVP